MHLMVDIETLGRTSHAPVIEIAVVKFDHRAVHDSFTSQVYPDFDKCKPDVSTLAWWNKQEATCPIHEGAPSFPSVLAALGGWLGATQLEGVWANAPSFDLVILHNLAAAHGESMPWNFRQYCDMRTLARIGKKAGLKRPKPDKPHVAELDAIAQAQWVININKMLVGRGLRVL